MFRSPRPQRSARPPRRGALGVEAILLALPSEATVYIVGGTYLVVAPTGLFMVAENTIDVAAGATAAATAAEQTRAGLSDQMPFVPFIDALVVSDTTSDTPRLPALCVPYDLVRSTIIDGPATIDTPTLGVLRELRFPVLR